MIATSTTLGINKTRYKNLAYDPLKAFAAIAPLAAIPFALIVNPSIPRRVHRQVEPWAGPGSAGNGKPHNLGAEMLKSAASRDVRHMPDRGSVAAMLDVITAHVAFMVMDLQVPLQEISMTRSALWASPP